MLGHLCYACKASLAALSAFVILIAFTPPTSAQHTAIIEWVANLSPARNPAGGAHELTVQTHASGKVTAEVDFPSQTVTFHVEAKDLSGVRKIEVRRDVPRGDVPQGDFGGPTVFTIYDAREGSFTGSLNRAVSGPAFTSVATLILNGQAGIVISTDADPDGDIAGKIIMQKHYEH
jgi:hypothetical protein